MKGDEAVLVEQSDGTYFEILFDRPTSEDLYLEITLSAKNGLSIDSDYIKEQVVANYILGANEPADTSALSNILYAIDPNLVASDLGVSDDGVTYVDLLENSAEDKYWVNDTSRITVTT